MTPSLEIGVLGPLRVVRDGEAIALRSRMQRLLLARLVIESGPVSTDALVDALWGERPPATALSTLKTHASNLRAALDGAGSEPLLVGHRGAYELSLASCPVDAGRFEEALANVREAAPEATLTALDAALGLWRGPAYADVRDEPFAQAEAARLDELRLVALERRFEAALALGRHHEAVAELEALVAEHPLRERLWALLMTALYQSGRQADALRACSTLRETLREEMGLDPSPEIQALERAILGHDPDLVPTPGERPRQEVRFRAPPHPLSPLIGRDADLAGVAEALATHRLVVLTGPGGIGKTRLAIGAAARLAPDFADGTVYVDLAAVADPALVPHAVAHATNTPPGELTADVVGDVCAWLERRQVLLVVDNCEHVLDAAAETVGRVLAECPLLTVLGTSREPLGLVGELDWPVPPLEAGAAGDTADYTAPALRLFAERASAARPSFSPDESNAEAVAHICRALDGLPLAIELAAARVAHLSPAQIAERLDDRFGLLTASDRRRERHQTLRDAIDWSYDLLAADEQRLFAELSVFVGECSLEAVEGICGEPQAGGGDVLETLASLVRKSLVVAVDTGTVVRYRLLETLREYAGRRLAATGDAPAAQRRHRDWFLEWVESFGSERSALSSDVAEVFELERANLRAAMETAARESRPDLVARILAATGALWRQGGGSEFDECHRWLGYVFRHEAQVEAEPRVACHMLASFLSRMTRNDEDVWDPQGRGEAGHALAAVEAAGSRESGYAALAWGALAHRRALHAHLQKSDELAAEVVDNAGRAVALAELLPPPWRIPVAWDLGMAYLDLGWFEQARDEAAAGVADFGRLDPEYRVEETVVRGCLATALHLLGDHETAARVARPAIAQVSGPEGPQGWMSLQPRSCFAVALAGAGDFATARRLARDALPRSRLIATPSNASDFVIALAAIAGLEGHWDRAATLLGAARRMGEGQPSEFRTPMGYRLYVHYNALTKEALGADRSRPAWQAGNAMGFEESIEFALEV